MESYTDVEAVVGMGGKMLADVRFLDCEEAWLHISAFVQQFGPQCFKLEEDEGLRELESPSSSLSEPEEGEQGRVQEGALVAAQGAASSRSGTLQQPFLLQGTGLVEGLSVDENLVWLICEAEANAATQEEE